MNKGGKNYKKTLRSEANRIVDVLNVTDRKKRKEVIEREINNVKEEIEKDLLEEIKGVASYRLIEDD